MSELVHPDSEQQLGVREANPPSYQGEFADGSGGDIISHDHASERQLQVSIGGGEGSLPPFPPHEVEFSFTNSWNIISHDSHLNKDGEALYQFLLTHSSRMPTYIISVSGTHTEDRTRTVSHTDCSGKTEDKIEHYTVTITDFAFSINLADYIVAGPLHVSHGDGEACYRGMMVRQVQTLTGRRKATMEEIVAFKEDKHARINNGVPPWLQLDGSHRYVNQLASSISVRQWVDEYIASPKWLKEFVYEKRVYGWNQARLQRAIKSVIKDTGYGGSIHIGFDLSANKIKIRPSNILSRIPLVMWLSKHIFRGGGRWEIASGMFALCQKQPVEPGGLTEGIAMERGSLIPDRLLETGEGLVKVRGYQEGDWFKEWESVIKQCVESNFQQSVPMRHPRYNAVNQLNGYQDTPVHSLMARVIQVDTPGIHRIWLGPG